MGGPQDGVGVGEILLPEVVEGWRDVGDCVTANPQHRSGVRDQAEGQHVRPNRAVAECDILGSIWEGTKNRAIVGDAAELGDTIRHPR